MKRGTNSWLIASSAMALCCLAPANAAEASDQSSVNSSNDYSLTDIVVTAQRREESLQDVPVAVTALNADALAQMRVANISNLSGAAPNLSIVAQGIQSTPIIAIRGISGGSSNNGVDPKAGIYLDGVYIGRSVGAIFDLADIERIEVLRGPQGTLFGRNATAGAISLTTSAPTGEFGVKQDLSYGNHKAFRSRTVLNLPALGPLSVKASYLHDEIRGDGINLLGGETIDLSQREPRFGTLTYADRLGSRNIDAVQVFARLDLNDLTIDYRFDWSDSRSTSRAVQQLGIIPGPAGTLLGAVHAFQPFFGGNINFATDRRLNPVANATSQDHVTVRGHNVTATWQQSDAVTVKSITAWRSMKQRPNIHDLASSGATRFTSAQFGALLSGDPAFIGAIPMLPVGPNDSFFSILTARSTEQDQFSQELQFQLTQDKFNITAGAFYFHEKSPAIDVLGVFQPVTNGVVIPNPVLDAAFGSGVSEVVATNSSMALYGQGTVNLSDTLDVSLGLRYTSDHRETDIISLTTSQGGNLRPGVYKSNYSKLNYTAILNWQPSSEVTAYAKVATGYVAGGIMSGTPYSPENLTSYELGLKASLMNNRLRANSAIFFMDYKDLQTQNFADGVQRFDNAGKATIGGFESEIDFVPLRGLTLSGSIGYSDFKYKEFILGGIDVADVARPAYYSKWTGRASANFEFGEMSNGAIPYIRAEGRYRSSFYLTSTPIASPVVEAANHSPGFWLVDARIGINSIPVGPTNINLSAWGKNLFNKAERTWGAPVTSLTGIYDWGRTYGIDLSVAF